MTWGWAGVRGTACWSLIKLVDGSSRDDRWLLCKWYLTGWQGTGRSLVSVLNDITHVCSSTDVCVINSVLRFLWSRCLLTVVRSPDAVCDRFASNWVCGRDTCSLICSMMSWRLWGARGGRGTAQVTSKNGVIRIGFNCTARSVVRHFLIGFRTEQVALCIWPLKVI